MLNKKITYTQVGDYQIPELIPSQENYHIGKYRRLHKKFLKENYPCFYSSMLLNGTLLGYIEKVDLMTKNELDRLIADMTIKQGVSEELKATGQLKWVGLMNNIQHSAEEIIYKRFIYTRNIVK